MSDAVVTETLVEDVNGAIYEMDNESSSNGALAAAKSHFADKFDYDYNDCSSTLFNRRRYRDEPRVVAVMR